jgi:hypothetical protein
MVHPAVIHPLTPGSPAYAMLKVGAIGSIVALRFALTRRNRDEGDDAQEQVATEPAAERQAPAHPVSRKKKKRRRR